MSAFRWALLAGLLTPFASPVFAQDADDAQVVGHTIPDRLEPGKALEVTITFRNTGAAAWTHGGGYKLGAVGDSDPFCDFGRVYLARDVAPGRTATFKFTLPPPVEAGTHVTDWRMVHEGVRWFGETLTRRVEVAYGPAPPRPPAVDWPPRDAVLGADRPDVIWTGDAHDAYEVHIGAADAPSSADGWNSGEVKVRRFTCEAEAGPLTPGTPYYVFVRLHNPNGWGDWSAPGRRFTAAGRLPTAPYFVAGKEGHQREHAIAYHPGRNEYLAAYMDARSAAGAPPGISAWRLDANGERIGPEIAIRPSEGGAGSPAVAANPAADEYLVAFVDWEGDLHARRVRAATGEPVDGKTLLTPATALNPDLAFAPEDGVYLLVWREDHDKTTDLYTLRLDGRTGAPLGGTINMTAAIDTFVDNPSIAYNAKRKEFFVAYQLSAIEGGRDHFDYHGQRVRASDGELLGASARLTSTPHWECNGDVAWDADRDRYLLVYQRFDPAESVLGQFVAPDGALVGDPIPIVRAPRHGGGVEVGWHPVWKEFLAAWMDMDSAGNYARRISQDGALLGEPFRTNGPVAGLGNWTPIVVPNPRTGEYLICWQNAHTDVYVRRYQPQPMKAR